MELRDFIQLTRRRWVTLVLGVLLGVGAAAAMTYSETPLYRSTARLYVSAAQSNTTAALQVGQLSAQRIQSYADLVGSQQLRQKVAETLNSPTAGGQVSATVVEGTVILQLSVVDSDPHDAQALAQAYAVGLTDLIRELETPQGGNTAPPIKATVVDPASLPAVPFTPLPERNLGAGALLGLLLGLGLAFVRDNLDTSIKSRDDIEALTHAPILGDVAYDSAARSRPLITALESHAPRVESFRVLRTNLQFVDVDAQQKVFVVTSALPQEGKTTTALNLALSLAQAGQRTLLMGCDLRRPGAAKALDLDNTPGVTTVLLGKVPLSEAIQKHPQSDLHFLGSGTIPPNPAELLQSRAMQELLEEVREQYDTVIIDSPPLLPVTDAALLAAQSDGAMLVTRHGKTTRDEVESAVARLSQVDASLLGVVLNMVPTGRRRLGYGYGYGYGYGEGPSAQPARKGHKVTKRKRKQ